MLGFFHDHCLSHENKDNFDKSIPTVKGLSEVYIYIYIYDK